MADVEQRAEAEASAKGLTGQARKSYIGGVFNRIRQAHAKATTPGARGRRMFNRRERVQARLDARLAMQPHREAIDVLRRQRNERIAAHQDEPRELKQEPKREPASDAIARERARTAAVGAGGNYTETDPEVLRQLEHDTAMINANRGLEARPHQVQTQRGGLARVPAPPKPPKREPAERERGKEQYPFSISGVDLSRYAQEIADYDRHIRDAEGENTYGVPASELPDYIRRMREGRRRAVVEYERRAAGIKSVRDFKPPKREPAERQRQHAIADAIKHGAPDFPPGTLAAAEGKPAAGNDERRARAAEIVQRHAATGMFKDRIREQYAHVRRIGNGQATKAEYEAFVGRPVTEAEYQEWRIARKGTPAAPPPPPAAPTKIEPFRHIDVEAGFNPYFVAEHYSPADTRRLIESQSADRLTEGVRAVEARTGRKYTGRRSKSAMASWILANMS